MITPRMTGVYSIAEAIDDSNKRPQKTILCIQNDIDDNNKSIQFTKDQLKSLDKVGQMVVKNGGKFMKSVTSLVKYLNSGM